MADINEILSKEAIDGIKTADKLIQSFDVSISKIIQDAKAMSIVFSSSDKIIKMEEAIRKLQNAQSGLSEAKKKEASIDKELQRVGAARAAAMDKEIQKEKEHIRILNMEVKTRGDAKAQLKEQAKELDKLTTSVGKQSQAVKDMTKKMQENERFIKLNSSALEKQKINIGKYKSALNGIGSAIVGAFAVGSVVAFGKAAYKAFEEQEIQNRKLLFSLKGDKVAFTDLTKQAGEMQKKLGIPDEVINGIQILAAESGKSVPQIKKITQAAAELSILTGEDLQSSYMKLNATLAGSAGRLTRIDSEFGTLTKDQLEHGAAIDLVISKYGGLAEKAVTPTKLLSTAWGEFLESVGSGGTILDKPLKLLANYIDLMGSALKTVKQIKSEVAADNLVNQSGNAEAEIGSMSAFYQKNGSSKKSADDKALNSYLATQQNTINARQKENLQLMSEYKTASFEVQKQKIAEIRVNNEYIKNVNAEVNAVKKSRETNKPDDNTKKIKANITEYQKLSTHIEDLTAKITELKIANEPIPGSLILDLINSKAKLDGVKETVAAIGRDMAAMQGKTLTDGKSSFEIPTSGKHLTLTKRDNGIQEKGGNDKDVKVGKDASIEYAQITADATFNIISNQENAAFDLKMSLLEKEKTEKLKNKKLTEDQKFKIEQEYAKKEARLKTEQFKKQKAADVIQAIINGALSVLKAPPGQKIFEGIRSAALIATIIAQKVPQFDAGSKSTPDTFIAGEKRPEWMITPKGKVQLVTKPTLFQNMAGATVIGGEETERIMKSTRPGGGMDFTPFINRMESSIVNAIKNKSELHINATGTRITEREGNTNKEYFNRKISWSRNQT